MTGRGQEGDRRQGQLDCQNILQTLGRTNQAKLEAAYQLALDALDQRRANRIAKLIRAAGFPIPTATIAELDYPEDRGINPTRMRRDAVHDWRSEPTNQLITPPPEEGRPTWSAPSASRPANENTMSSTWHRRPGPQTGPSRAVRHDKGRVAASKGADRKAPPIVVQASCESTNERPAQPLKAGGS